MLGNGAGGGDDMHPSAGTMTANENDEASVERWRLQPQRAFLAIHDDGGVFQREGGSVGVHLRSDVTGLHIVAAP